MKTDIVNSLKVLKSGGTIIYPTDTVWGIGCDATNFNAVKKIYRLKKREDSKSMLILVNNSEMVNEYVEQMPEIARQLFEVAEKPLTLILPGAINLPYNLISNDNTIGIRITKDKFCQQLIEFFKKPIVSTSANFSGDTNPSNFAEINPELLNEVDYVVKYRQNDMSRVFPSSIIKLGLNGQFQIIRK